MLLLTPLAHAVAADTGMAEDAAPCEGAYADFALPSDGLQGVPPGVIPVLGINADCSAGDVVVTLTPDAGEPYTTTISASASGLYFLSDVILLPDTGYVLSASAGVDGWMSITHNFSTGTSAVGTELDDPTLEAIGGEAFPDYGTATVSLRITMSETVDEASWELKQTDRGIVSYGGDSGEVVVSSAAEAGDELCFTLVQYRADGVVMGSSDEVCQVVEELQDGEAICNCAVGGPATVGWLSLLAALGLVRRRSC